MSSSADAPQQPRQPGPHLALSIAVMLVAVAIGITGLAIGVSSAVHRVTHFADGPRGQLPTQLDAALTPATWQVYVAEAPGGQRTTSITPADVLVTDPDGAPVAVRGLPGGLTEEIDLGVRAYHAAVRFDVHRPGAYRIAVRAEPGGAGTPILVAKSLGSDLSGLVKWFAIAGAGFLVGCIGVTMLIAGIVRRRAFRRRLASGGTAYGSTAYGAVDYPGRYVPASGPPAGWYDDPHLPSMQRWWDGSRWTDRTRNRS